MKKIVYSLVILCVGLLITGCNSKNTDALKFKKEYESLNGKVSEESNNKYSSIEIDKNNIIKYSNADEIIDILDKGTGIIYFGYPECPWSRNAVPILLESTKELGIENIYYMNIKDERDEIIVNENNSLDTVKESSDDYKKILKALDSVLDEYDIKDSNGNIITSIKKVDTPLVVFVLDGEIVGTHSYTVESQTDPYVLLNDEQKNELMDIYIDLIHKVLNDVCDSEC